MTAPGAPQPRHAHRLRLRRRTRIIISAALGLVAGMTAAAIYIYTLTTRIPEWFDSAAAFTSSSHAPFEAAGAARAAEFENALLTEFSKVRPADPTLQPGEAWRSEPWAVAMQPSDINNWLQHQAPRWATNLGKGEMEKRWPAALKALRVSIAADQTLRIGALVRQDADSARLYGLRVTPRVRADGLWLDTHEVEIGRVAVQAPWVIRRARSVVQQMVPDEVRSLPDLESLLDAAGGTRPLIARPVVRLADGRKVRILDMHCEAERLVFTCQTEGGRQAHSGRAAPAK